MKLQIKKEINNLYGLKKEIKNKIYISNKRNKKRETKDSNNK